MLIFTKNDMKCLFSIIVSFITFFQISAQIENQLSMQDWQYPYDVHNITLSDTLEIAYVDEGQGEQTLLFLHGLGSNLKAWQKNIEYHKKDYRCIALDLPGYGKSNKGNHSFNMTFFAQMVHSFIAEMKLKNVVLVGHSMGGQIAMHTVFNNSEAIEKLILIATAGFEVFSEKEIKWFRNIYTADIIKSTKEAQIAKNFHLNFYDFPDDAQFMIDDRLLMRQTAEYEYYCNMIPQCLMGMLNEPVYNRLSEIDLPTLVIFGENDLLIPNKILHPTLTTSNVAEGGRDGIQKSELVLIPLAGHFVQWEQAEQVNKTISDFLR